MPLSRVERIEARLSRLNKESEKALEAMLYAVPVPQNHVDLSLDRYASLRERVFTAKVSLSYFRAIP